MTCKCARDRTPCTNCVPGRRCCNPHNAQQNEPSHSENVEESFINEINAAYEEVVKWRRNVFMIPTGHAGKGFIKEIIALINAWNDETPICTVA